MTLETKHYRDGTSATGNDLPNVSPGGAPVSDPTPSPEYRVLFLRFEESQRELAEARQRIDNLQRDREMLDREVMKGMAEYDEARAVLRRLVEWASDPSKPLIENHADIVAAARKFL